MADEKKKEFPLPTEIGLYMQIIPDGNERIVQIFRLPSILAFQGIGDSQFFELTEGYKVSQFIKIASTRYVDSVQKFVFLETGRKDGAIKQPSQKPPDIQPAADKK